MGRPRACLSASGSSCMARPAGVHDASERRSQGVLFTGLLLFALSRTKKALRRYPGAFVTSDGFPGTALTKPKWKWIVGPDALLRPLVDEFPVFRLCVALCRGERKRSAIELKIDTKRTFYVSCDHP